MKVGTLVRWKPNPASKFYKMQNAIGVIIEVVDSSPMIPRYRVRFNKANDYKSFENLLSRYEMEILKKVKKNT
tara:strand:- start:768 stop:986 length:219 start_codon:yes stop_codon:yes gene_type:complete